MGKEKSFPILLLFLLPSREKENLVLEGFALLNTERM
jgi:hypothetical protein